MQIQSPLSNLRDILAQAKHSAGKYNQQFQKDEAGTRLALIDPVLSALGWQLWNPSMVRVESTSQVYRADYVLMDTNENPNIIVEAKPLGSLITPAERKQLFAYAAVFKANSAFITNGSDWEHYEDTVALGAYSLRWQKNLAVDNINEMATYLIQRLDAANVWPKDDDLDTIERRLAQVESDTQTLAQKIGRTVSPAAVPPVVPPPVPPNFVNLDALPDITGTTPTQLRLPDGSTIKVGGWSEVLVECCKYTLATNPNIKVPLRDKSAKTVNLLSLTQLPRTVEVDYNGTPLYVRRLYDAQGSVANALHILALVVPVKHTVKAAVVFGLV